MHVKTTKYTMCTCSVETNWTGLQTLAVVMVVSPLLCSQMLDENQNKSVIIQSVDLFY